MKALTVMQPWAWAIAAGLKRYENRSWRTSYRGPLYIHAGLGRKWAGLYGQYDAMTHVVYPTESELCFGGIVAKVNLTDCLRVEACGGDPWAFGPWCWVLEDVEPVPFVKVRGGQGLWTVSVGVAGLSMSA